MKIGVELVNGREREPRSSDRDTFSNWHKYAVLVVSQWLNWQRHSNKANMQIGAVHTLAMHTTQIPSIFSQPYFMRSFARSPARSVSLQARFGPKCVERRRWRRRSCKWNKSLNMNRHFSVHSKSDRLLCAKGRLQLSDTHLRNA